MMSEEETVVFVYGTLKRGRVNNGVMHRAGGTFISDARSDEKLYLITAWGAPIVLRPDQHKEEGKHIKGELWRVPIRGLEGPLDRLEGHPYVYTRQKVWFTDTDQERHLAWIYLVPRQSHWSDLPPPEEEYAPGFGFLSEMR